jgi:hypothetical protein
VQCYVDADYMHFTALALLLTNARYFFKTELRALLLPLFTTVAHVIASTNSSLFDCTVLASCGSVSDRKPLQPRSSWASTSASSP